MKYIETFCHGCGVPIQPHHSLCRLCEEKPNDSLPLPQSKSPAYAEVGKLCWTLKALLDQVRRQRFCFAMHDENQDIRLAITHLEDALFRLERVRDNE